MLIVAEPGEEIPHHLCANRRITIVFTAYSLDPILRHMNPVHNPFLQDPLYYPSYAQVLHLISSV